MATARLLRKLIISILLGNIAALPAGPINYVPVGLNNYTFGAVDNALNNRLDAENLNHSAASNGSTIFPPGKYLGHGLDMTAIMPFDIKGVTSSISHYHRMIKLENKTYQVQIKGGDVWTVPMGVDIGQDVTQGDSLFTTFASGKEAETNLDGGGDLSVRYKVVQGDASLDAGIHTNFQQGYQYAMFGYTTEIAQASFSEIQDHFDEVRLRRDFVDKLQPFDSTDKFVVAKYKALFRLIGSHLITNVDYGARLSLAAWASNKDSTVNKYFNLDVGAALEGLPVEGKIGVDVTSSSQYETFTQSFQKTCSCLGGDSALGTSICPNTADPNIYETFEAWTKTSKTHPDVTGFATIALWDLMTFAKDGKLASYARHVSDAYHYLAQHPQIHRTPARISISADWAEMGMLSPGAFLEEDPNNPLPAHVVLTSTKVKWDSTTPTKPALELIIDVIIRNFGTPIDIYLAHGSNGETYNTGRVAVNILGATYTAQGITDNGWNLQRFAQVPVSQDGVEEAMLQFMAVETVEGTATARHRR